MKSPLKIALSWFSRKFQEITGELPKEIQEEINKEVSPQKAVNNSFKKQGIFGKLREKITEVIEKAAEIGFGKKPPKKIPELFEAWDSSKMNLSEKLHGADKEMRSAIINTIKEQLKLGKHAEKAALALYDGYNSGKKIIRQQELPLYMKSIVNLARRGELSEKEKQTLQRLIRQAERQTAKMGENGAPNIALKTAYNELLEAVKSGKEKVLERGIKTAVEEKSRYVAERIARTEAARAWADAFIARYKDDDDVVAYKWQLGSRHPHFDICDMYADANLYNLGAGIFPKDKCPTLPVHPHCLCHLTPIFKNEVDITKQKDRLKEGGAEWLKSLTESERVKLLGINGALQFKNGGDFLLSLRGYSSEVMGTRLKNVVTDAGNSGKINAMDITKEWANAQNKKGSVTNRQSYTVDGVEYFVDGRYIVLSPNHQEKAIATLLSDIYGKNVEFVPKINYPPNIQTPDYLIDNERFDLKSPTGKGKYLLQGLIAKKKQQSHNFIIDLTNCPLEFEEIERQVTDLYRSPRTAFLDKLVFIKENDIVRVYKKDKNRP